MSVRAKLLLLLLLPLLGGWVLITFLSSRAARVTLQEHAAAAARAGAERIIDAYGEALASGRESSMLPALYALRGALNASGAFFCDGSGNLLAHTDVAQRGKRLPPKEAALAEEGGFFLSPGGRPGAMLVLVPVSSPLPKDPEELAQLESFERPAIGALGVYISTGEAAAAAADISSRISAILLVIYAALLLTVFLISGPVLRPVRQLTEGTRRLRQGEYGALIPAGSSDEFGELARSFNEMSTTLAATTVSKDYLNAVVENIADILLVTDTGLAVRRANRAALEALGLGAAEAEGRPVQGFFSGPEGQADFGERLRKDGIIKDLELTLRGKNAVPVLVSASLISNADGSPAGAAVIARDITLRKQYEAALARSNEDLERFAFVASHDLQEPLRTLSNYIQMLEARYSEKLGDGAASNVAFVTDAIARMRALVRDLLEYSKIGGELKPERVDSGAALSSVLGLLQKPLEEAGAEVERGEMPVISAAPGHLERLMQNLISNAVKFRDGRAPKVRVEARRERGGWTFSVADNGEGIDPAYAHKLFKIFGRLHGASVSGAGIGLAACKRIVELYGGRIWFDSEPGRGSTFFFSLPDPAPKAG